MRRLRYVAAFAALAILGCTQDSAEGPDEIDVELWQDELPIRQPWLREHLPEQSLVYVRIPHLLGLFAMPKGNVLDPALRSKVNVENVQKVHQGLIDNVLTLIPLFSEPKLRLLQQHVQSPVEVSGTFLPAPASLIAVTTDIDSNDAFVAVLEALGLTLMAPLDAANTAQIAGAPTPLFVQFDAASGRLLAHTGPSVTAESFANLLAGMDRNVPHRMRSLENRVDESGQGLFLWVGAKEAMPMLQMFVPREQLDELIDFGFDKVSAVALGWGAANGKSRLAIVADVPTDDDRGFVPYVNNKLTARSVGDPDGLMVVSIPTVEEFSRLEALVLKSADAEAASNWANRKAEFTQLAGITIEEIFTAIGPEIVVIMDRAGDYLAIRVRDAALWDSILERTVAKIGNAPDEKQVAGNTYYHLALPTIFSGADDKAATELGWIAELLGRQRDHLYWTQDGDFLYMASVPQVLFDRAALGADTDVGEWLRDKQRVDAEHAVFSISGTSRKIPSRLYAFYIELLQLLADTGQAEIDVWSMPTAAQLKLPELGTMSFTVSLGNPTLAAEFTFENNPGELFGGVGTIAAVGIVAAIAIPAYQDYTIRAQVASGLNLSAVAKVQVTEFYQSNGRFPGPADVEQLGIPENAGPYVWSVTVEPDTGVIMVEYMESVAATGGQLFLEPTAGESGQITWSCWATLADKHLPAACRR